MDVDEDEDVGGNVPIAKKKKNKQRVLLLSSRGITHRMRHLMNDLEALLPHVKKGAYFCKVQNHVSLFIHWHFQTRNSIQNPN